MTTKVSPYKIPPNPNGRPTTYSEEIANHICNEITIGKSLRKICEEDGMPMMGVIFRWLIVYKEFSEQYAYAREQQAETFADEMMLIADNIGNQLITDGLPVINPDGSPVMVVDAVAVNHARLKVDTRKWIASKLKPKVYGEKLSVESSVVISSSIKDARERSRNK